MRRREFITGLCGVAAAPCLAWPLAAHAQQDGRMRRVGLLTRSDETDRRVQAEQGALREGLAKLGWIEGRNVRFDLRSSADDPVAGGLLQNIARPEGNVTGITSAYQSMGGKWLELLKEAAPQTARVALIFNSDLVSETYFS